MQIQCESNAHQSRPRCSVRNWIHAYTLTSSGHTSTQLPWCRRQIFTSASHHIASWVERICGTQCVAKRSALTTTRVCMPCPFWFVRTTCNCAIQFNPDRNRLWKWIGINPDWIRIGQMRIQCGRIQTGFDLVQCALGVQCGQALKVQPICE